MNNVRFTYLRDKNNVAFGCLAVSLDRDSNTISYGLSVCHSTDDVYDRHYGRSKAEGRLNAEPELIKFVRLDQCSAHDITRHVMYDIYQQRDVLGKDQFGEFTIHGLPQRARDCAKAWLKNYAEPASSLESYFGDPDSEGYELEDYNDYDDEDLESAFDRGEQAWTGGFEGFARRTSRVG